MQLRDRQVLFCDRGEAALKTHGNGLGVAPTGAGKTIMGCELVRRIKPRACLFLQHRDELVAQNRQTFDHIAPELSSGLYTADRKEWGYRCTFGMVQTVARNLDKMPPLDMMVVDEGHHSVADTYRRIIDRGYKSNSDMKLLLLTATSLRGDKKGLRSVVDNCFDQITLQELIKSGHLVPPRPFVIDIGVREQLQGVRKLIGDFDMDAVAAIMDRREIGRARVGKECRSRWSPYH